MFLDVSFWMLVQLLMVGIYIAFTSVSPRMGANGWPFANVDAFPEAGVDPINNAEHVKDLYLAVDPHYDGR